MSEVDTQWGEQIDNDLMKKATEANLIETGRYRAVVEKFDEQKQEKEFFDEQETKRNPFFGKPYGSLTLRLGSKRDGKGAKAPFMTLESPKVTFLRISPSTVMSPFDTTKLSKESKHFGWLAKLASADKASTALEVIEWAKNNPFEISIRMYEAGERDGRSWDAGNTVVGLYSLKEGE